MKFVNLRTLYWRYYAEWSNIKDSWRFFRDKNLNLGYLGRISLLFNYYRTSASVSCPHTPYEIFSFSKEILNLSESIPGCAIEAGCFKGGSTAKFSRAACLAGRKLLVFDSFEGIPQNVEDHAGSKQGQENFSAGSYSGSLEEVKRNVEKFGTLSSCEFIKGWFDDTMPNFRREVAAIYLDVDLVSSTKTCIKHLYPLLAPGGALYSQDGHLPLVCDLFDDDAFWRDELGCAKPSIEGLRTRKLIRVSKPR
jgi:O-methyltransferase